ncbi:DNA cytosine methyltransferase [Pediococcus pentosaceus]|uniref:Cytosine-specific methyltransferase n=1 Tax=Pediococcus pentosaceus TaxID=1255 RepID=A0ABD7XAC0_PEDPE|nr:DNA cytosine methyltransferase [Pediococcus pentosaceus]WEA58320.1 DNA cytosine methyltransferase [Pediococcus pentosaceus]
MKFIDLFAGIGGFRMGMERAGHECVGYVEIDKFARKSYEAIYNTEGEWTKHDITKVTDEEWHQFRGEVDVLCGGFPCQAFSIAGKRRGFADETRGTLFFEVARAAKEIQPSYLFLENVKGLLNHDKGRTFRTILSTLDECGYDVEWQLCNSKNFGVPQNRERVIIIGHLRGASTREVFFDAGQSGQTTSSNVIKVIGNTSDTGFRSHDVLDPTGLSTTLMSRDYKGPKQVAVKQVGNISDSDSFGGNPQTGRVYDPEGLSPTLNTMTGGGREPKIIDDQGRKNKKVIPTDISPTLRAQSHGNEPKVAIPVITPDRINKRQNGRRFKENGDPMFTINTVDKHGILIKKPTVGDSEDLRIRKLTPRECWRLQGFPDWAFDKAQEVNSNSQLYKQAGNSVTVPLMEFVANRLKVV